jgi:hypothetical protein
MASNLMAVIGRRIRQSLVAGTAVAALASSPAPAKSQTPPDLTLDCTTHPTERPGFRQQTTVEVWFNPGRVILNHTLEFSARIDDRAIRFEGDYPDGYIHNARDHTMGVIDRTTGSYQLTSTTTAPGVIMSAVVGHCSRAPSKKLF